MEKPTKRKAFNFLRSYFDVVNELQNETDKCNFLMAIINKQFLDEDPKELSFIVNLCYSSQKHAIEASVKGWKRVSNTDMEGNPITNPPTNPPTNPETDPKEEEVKEEVKEKLIIIETKHELFLKDCLESYTWIESISMREKIPEEKIELALKDFNGHLLTTGQNHLSLKDYKYHFVMWVKKRKEASK